MLKAETSLQDISQILGHSDINVTETYLRVDVEQLRDVYKRQVPDFLGVKLLVIADYLSFDFLCFFGWV